MVARLPWGQEVVGSSPTTPTDGPRSKPGGTWRRSYALLTSGFDSYVAYDSVLEGGVHLRSLIDIASRFKSGGAHRQTNWCGNGGK